jgi:SAM-dependent methyltransferase
MSPKHPIKSVQDVFDLADSYCEAALLQFANNAGLFEILKVPASAQQVAGNLGWVVRKTGIVLDALASLGLLVKNDECYQNSFVTNACLLRSSPEYIGDLVEHERLQWALWGRMDEVLRNTSAVQGQQDLVLPTNSKANDVFHSAMMQLSREIADTVAGLPCWSDKRRVIDLAGGHGRYLAFLAEHNRALCGEIWDLPSAQRFAEQTLKEYSLQDRITFHAKDIGLPENYRPDSADGALLIHCLHHFSDAGIRQIMQAVFKMLRPGGTLVVVDVFLERNRIEPISGAMFSLYMMMNTRYGEVYPISELAEVMQQVGFQTEVRRLGNMEDDALIIGMKA